MKIPASSAGFYWRFNPAYASSAAFNLRPKAEKAANVTDAPRQPQAKQRDATYRRARCRVGWGLRGVYWDAAVRNRNGWDCGRVDHSVVGTATLSLPSPGTG